MNQDAPSWFREAVAAQREDRIVEVEGCPIHYLRWGDPAKPALVLVHGGAAHAHWWTSIAPWLARSYHVVALDLSGHGDSGHRERYGEVWLREILSVAADAGIREPPVVVGHSMGGLITITTAALHGDRLAGAVIVDAPVRRPDPESAQRDRVRAFRNPKLYPDLATAMAHFRLIPEQPCENAWLVDYIARQSLRSTPQGWTWKFDPRVFSQPIPPMRDYLASVRIRVALFRGELSAVVPAETGEYLYELLGRNSPLVEIPAAHHHLILDQPLAFVAALRALLADWEHSVPRRRPA